MTHQNSQENLNLKPAEEAELKDNTPKKDTSAGKGDGSSSGETKALKDDDDRDWKKVHIQPKVKVIKENTILVRGYDGTQKQIIAVSDRNTCPTQSESIPLSGN
jgi:hypothetical protein